MARLTKAPLTFAVILCFCATALAIPPDLTNGGVPADTVTINLGPTGLRGWVYHVRTDTGESRQIQVKVVGVGSPADGILAVNDVILGANGTGANPVNFTADARKSLALAIADAEARDPATLKLIRWRAGATDTVALTLRPMGAYSATAPYNCPKSAQILEEGLQSIMTSETAGRYSFGTLSLLAGNNPSNPNNAARGARAQTEARALIPTVAEMTQMKSNVRDTASTWQRGHTLIVLAEYYLVTGDAQVLPAIEAYALNVAKNQSMFGTLGHIYAEKNPDGSNNGPMGGVYGPVNSTGMPCFLGLLLAKECGLTNPEIAPAIERTSRFFAYYAGLGAVPYGEHEAFWQGHENNGKSGLAALAFGLQANRAKEQKFFAKMATASTSERDVGHTGPFFNYLWAPLGAGCGGEEAAAAHFSRISWILDLARRWDGAFDYDTLNGDGSSSGSQYSDFRMSTAALLLYSLPLRQLHLTGRGHDPARWLSSADVAEAGFSDTYNAPSRTTSQLVTDLGDWSPKIQHLAADELAKRTTETTALLPALHALANDPNGTSRVGACLALGKIANASSAPVLAALLTDPRNHVRYAAAEGMRYLSTSAKLGQINTILSAAASTATPLLPYNEEDPLHFAHAKLAQLLFYSGTAYGPKGCIWGTGINGIDRNYLYPAIRAVAANPIGFARSSLNQTYKNLTAADVTALADTLVDSVRYRAPADKMFGGGIRQGGIEILQANGISEGVPLSMIFDKNDGRGSTTSDVLGVLQKYAGRSTTVVPDPDVVGYLNDLLGGANAAEAQAVLDAIAADTNPTPLTPFKSIQSVTADSPALNLPSANTMLHVASTDHANGDSVYTWRKVHGAGMVSFTPNGTNDSRNAALLFDGIPGKYLFEVTMSDSRGLTEVSARVPVTLYNPGGTLPPNDPPVANNQQVTLVQETPTPVTFGASDPEGYALVFRVATQPAHGKLSGTAPNLIYTPEMFYRGADSFTFEVMDSEGQVNSATVSLIIMPAPNLYWDGNDVTGNADGGNGIWDHDITNNWDDANSGGIDAKWNNTNNDTAIFGGTAGTVTLGTNVTVGGLQFITTGYSIAPGSGLFTITFGAPGDINVAAGTSTLGAVLAGSGTITKTGGGILVLAANNTFTGNTAITGGTLQIGSNGSVGTLGPATYVADISIASGAKLLFNNNSNQILSGVISGDGSLQKGGGGTLILSGANTYTGKTTIAAPGAGGPTLSVSSFNSVNGGTPLLTSSSLGAPTTVANGTIDLGSSGNTRSCTLIYTGSGETTDRVMNVSFNSSSKHTITASTSGLLKFTSAFTIVPSSGGLTSSGLYLRGSGNGELAGGMANAATVNIIPGFFEKADAGTWTIGGAFNIKGTTTVSGGTLSLQKQESLYNNDPAKWTPTNISVNSGTTLALGVGDSASGCFDSTALNAFLDSSHMGLSTATTGFKSGAILGFDTTWATAGTFAYSSVIGNLGTATSTGLLKMGSGTLVLDQANTYTGTTTASAGKLFINGDQTAANGAVSVSANATLGGTGIIGGAATIAATGKLEFNLGTNAAGHDKLELAATKVLTFSGASTLTITSSGGASIGNYTLLTAPGGITGSAPATLILPANWVATVSKSGNDLVLNVTSTGVASDPYTTWAVGAAFGADTNNDGVANGMAWLLGAASPSAAATNKLPAASRDGGNLRLTFRCLKSAGRGGVVLKVQSSNDLGMSDPWTLHEASVPDADGAVGGVTFDTTADAEPAYINVIADIPAAGTKLYARLVAVEP